MIFSVCIIHFTASSNLVRTPTAGQTAGRPSLKKNNQSPWSHQGKKKGLCTKPKLNDFSLYTTAHQPNFNIYLLCVCCTFFMLIGSSYFPFKSVPPPPPSFKMYLEHFFMPLIITGALLLLFLNSCSL